MNRIDPEEIRKQWIDEQERREQLGVQPAETDLEVFEIYLESPFRTLDGMKNVIRWKSLGIE